MICPFQQTIRDIMARASLIAFISSRPTHITLRSARYFDRGSRSAAWCCVLFQDALVRNRLTHSNEVMNIHFRLARAKSHPIFSDTDLNTDDVVYLNIYQNLLLCAYKMHSYLRDWGLSTQKNATFIHGTLFIS